ncbi:MAG: hypothetical protein ABL997_21270 [Planctomycetota bacterium]
MLKSALFALLVAAALPAQVTVTFTAVSGSVAATGGPTHTIAAGTNLANGLNLSSSATSGIYSVVTSLQVQPMTVASGGHEIRIDALSNSPNGGIYAASSLLGLVTLQSPTVTQVVLDLEGGDTSYQAGGGQVDVDIDNDGVVELRRVRGLYRIPISVGPAARTIGIRLSAGVTIWGGSRGGARFDLRVVPGTCQCTTTAPACPGANIILWYRETIQSGIEVFIPNSSTTYASYRHMIVVLGSRELLPALSLPVNACPLHVDPVAYWFVPRPGSTNGGTVHLTVPPVVLPLVGYLQGVEYQSDTGGVFTTETLRIDCQ